MEALREYMIPEGVVWIIEIRIIGGLLVLAATTTMGFCYSNRLRLRIKHLRDFKRLMIYLKGEISHSSSSLPDAIAIIAKKEKGTFEDFLERLLGELNSLKGIRFYEAWEQSFDGMVSKTCLTKEDAQLIRGLGKTMGHMDKHTQLQCIEVFLNELEDEINRSVEGSKDKVRIYNVTGVLFGAFVVIILS